MRVAFFTVPLQGHFQPTTALAQALTALGHQCYLVCHPDVQVPPRPWLRLPIDAASCEWSPNDFIRHARHPGFPFGVKRIVADMAAMTDAFCRSAPQLLRKHRIDGIVCDQMEAAGALVADHLKIPYVSLAAALPINREPHIPLGVLGWPYGEDQIAIRRNRGGEWIADMLTAPHDRTIANWSARWGLKPRHRLSECLSPLADISQMFPNLDFPRRELPDTFHYVGPLRSADEVPEFVAESDTRPLVYASLGSLQGHRLGLLQRIAKACRRIDVRLAITYGNALSREQAATIDADTVVAWAPQAQMLKQSDAVITHAGLNTVLDAISAGVPMLCLPLAFEQPCVSARVARAGAGETLSHRSSVPRIAAALSRLLSNPRYREQAAAIAGENAKSSGAIRAATIVEQALMTCQPAESAARPV